MERLRPPARLRERLRAREMDRPRAPLRAPEWNLLAPGPRPAEPRGRGNRFRSTDHTPPERGRMIAQLQVHSGRFAPRGRDVFRIPAEVGAGTPVLPIGIELEHAVRETAQERAV